MTLATIVMIFSSISVALCFLLAAKVRAMKRVGGGRRQTLGDAVGVLLAISILVLGEATLQRFMRTSFLSLMRSGSTLPWQVFAAGALQGIVYEYVGQFVFPAWYYPAAERRRWLLLLLPLFWGIFMLIMQDTWAIFRYAGASWWLAALLAGLIQYGLIEGFNLITHAWKYKGLANKPWVLIAGWVLLLAPSFVVIYNHIFTSPFGL